MLNHKGFTSLVSKFLLLCSIVSTAACGATSPANQRYISDPQNVEGFMNSAVAMYNEERNVFFCSGFYVSEDVIITARHCVMDQDELVIMRNAKLEGDYETKNYFFRKIYTIAEYDAFRYETDYSIKKARIVYFSSSESQGAPFDTYDLAVLKLLPGERKSKHWLKIATENPKIGEKVYSFSQPAGLPWILSEGIVAQYSIGKPGTPIDTLMINAPVTFGSSGSGWINNRGEIVGLTSMLSSKAPYVSFSMSVERMNTLLYGLDLS